VTPSAFVFAILHVCSLVCKSVKATCWWLVTRGRPNSTPHELRARCEAYADDRQAAQPLSSMLQQARLHADGNDSCAYASHHPRQRMRRGRVITGRLLALGRVI
jgi:hypothetical protein